jgi:hypothetical protein
MPNVSTPTVLCNLRAIIELICAYPSHTVLTASDGLGIEPGGLPGDLLDLQVAA